VIEGRSHKLHPVIQGGSHPIIHKKHSTSTNERHSLTELTVSCTTADWVKLSRQPCGLIPICRKQSQNFEMIILK
jgi:hypothetical protein